MIFCDLSTPKADGTFNVYDDVREKLVARGIPREEVAFIDNICTFCAKALFLELCVYYKTLAEKLHPRTC